MKITIPGWLQVIIRQIVGTERGNLIIAFAESGLAEAFNALKDVLAALKTGNVERERISFASFLDHLPEPVRSALIRYVQERYTVTVKE